MALLYKTQAFVFKKEDRSEADRVFSVFTQDLGRVDVFGKGIRKISSKLRGGVEIFSFSDIEFVQGKRIKTLTDAVFLQKHNNVTEDPEKFLVAHSISNVLEHFIRGQELDKRIWDFLTDIFLKLDDIKTNNKFLYYYFFWNFMEILGHMPELSCCAVCRQTLKPEVLYFSNKDGGIICKNCFATKKEGVKILTDAVKIARLIFKKDWDLLVKLKIAPMAKKSLKEISDNYYHYLVGNYSKHE